MTFLQLKKIFNEKLQGKYVLFGNPDDPASTNTYWMRMNGVEGANIVGGHKEGDKAVARKLEMIMQKIQTKNFTVYDDEDAVKTASEENQKKKALEEAEDIVYDGTEVQESPSASALDEISQGSPVEESRDQGDDQEIDINDFAVESEDLDVPIVGNARSSVGQSDVADDIFESFGSEKEQLQTEAKTNDMSNTEIDVQDDAADREQEEILISDEQNDEISQSDQDVEKEKEKEKEEEKVRLMSGLRKKGVRVGEANPNFRATPPKLSEKERNKIEEEQRKKEEEEKERVAREEQEKKERQEEEENKRAEEEQMKKEAEEAERAEQEKKGEERQKEEDAQREREKKEAQQREKERALQEEQRKSETAKNPSAVEDIFESFGEKQSTDTASDQVSMEASSQESSKSNPAKKKSPDQQMHSTAHPVVNYEASFLAAGGKARGGTTSPGTSGAAKGVQNGAVASQMESSFVNEGDTPGDLPLLEAIDLFWKNPQHEHAQNVRDFIADVEKFSNQYFSHFSDEKMRTMYGWQTLRESASESFHVSSIFTECESKFGPQALNKYIHSLPNR